MEEGHILGAELTGLVDALDVGSQGKSNLTVLSRWLCDLVIGGKLRGKQIFGEIHICRLLISRMIMQ